MSSFSTTKKHPVDGDMRQCLAIDDFFGGHEYGYWFAKQGVIESITFSTSHKKMEEIIYAEDEVRTAPVPEEYRKKREKTVEYTQSELITTNSWQLENQELIELMERLGAETKYIGLECDEYNYFDEYGITPGKSEPLYFEFGAEWVTLELAQKILNEVKNEIKKAELRGKIIVLRSELIEFAGTETGRTLSDCIQRMIDKYEAQLRALEQEKK